MQELVDGIVTSIAHQGRGLYESFYFKATHQDGRRSFWLKHNFLLPTQGKSVRLEATLVVWAHAKAVPQTFKYEEEISLEQFDQLRGQWQGRWTGLDYKFQQGGGWTIGQNKLKGGFGQVQWQFALKSEGDCYLHLRPKQLYLMPFPKKKLLTRDSLIQFKGSLKGPWGDWSGGWTGMNGHNWGSEHAHQYAYANCNQFKQDANAFFDGFSAKIKLGPITSPFLTCASLKVNGEWFHFNHILSSARHQVHQLEKKIWKATLQGPHHRLQIRIDGAGRDLGWVCLPYSHPSGKTSKVYNTKYASGKIELEDREGRVLSVLTSDYFELETL